MALRRAAPSSLAAAGLIPTSSTNDAAAAHHAGGRRPFKVLVTGFHDWRDLSPIPTLNLFRCRDNPSCRLLLGEASFSPPVTRSGGALPGELARLQGELAPGASTVTGPTSSESGRAADGASTSIAAAGGTRAPSIDWTFQTLPTVWQTSSVVDYLSFDAVVHIGLGVYDCHDKIIVEDGTRAKGGEEGGGGGRRWTRRRETERGTGREMER